LQGGRPMGFRQGQNRVTGEGLDQLKRRGNAVGGGQGHEE